MARKSRSNYTWATCMCLRRHAIAHAQTCHMHVVRRGPTKMSTKLPFLARLGIYRISAEKQETFLKLLALSTAAILCNNVLSVC